MFRFFLFLYLGLSFASQAFAKSRLLTLYPWEDIRVVEQREETTEISLTNILFAPPFPCLLSLDTLPPVLFQTIKGGVSCSALSTPTWDVSLNFFPVISFGLGHDPSDALALLAGASYTQQLSESAIFHIDFNTAFSHATPHVIVGELSPWDWYLGQQWELLLSSSLAFSLISNFSGGDGMRLRYQRTLPLALRPWGMLGRSHGVEVSTLGFSYRYPFRYITLGAGLAYFVVHYDQLRFAGILPDFYFSVHF